MKVLIACEESQEVCKAFRAKGHEAYSCDLIEPSGGHPEWHILGNAIKALEGGQIVTMDGVTHDVGNWDLLIAHPPCTYLTNAGARHIWKGGQLQPDRVQMGILARDWLNSGVDRMITCCLNCTSRHQACHDTCEKYKAEKKDFEERKAFVYELNHSQSVYHRDYEDKHWERGKKRFLGSEFRGER